MSNPFQKVFIEEAQEIFESLEQDFVLLESATNDSELIHKIFRELHTLKGSGAMFDFHRLSGFAHDLETLFDSVRNEKLSITPEIITVSLESIDLLKAMLQNPDDMTSNVEQENRLVQSIKQLLPKIETAVHSISNEPPRPAKNDSIKVYRVNYKPDNDIFIKGINPFVLFKNLSGLGKLYSYAHEENIPVLSQLNPEWCYTSWTSILVTNASLNEIKDIFIFAEGSGELSITEIFSGEKELEEQSIPLIGDILLSKGDITREEVERIIGSRKFFGEQAVEMGFTSKEKVASALFEQNTLQSVKKDLISHTNSSSIRVQNEKLDVLTNAVSELVTLQARLTQYAEIKKESELTTI
ncbi:MAG: chemotaxis protein CheA, partial [Fibrobacter sp.]|nr:chemotaxis protein CheA [Fibrobacter sp.]